MIIKTESGSIYEVEQRTKRIRRVGVGKCRVTEDWRTFEHMTEPKVGRGLVIIWPDDEPRLEGTPSCVDTIPATRSTPVVGFSEGWERYG